MNSHLCIEVVSQTLNELTLNGILSGHQTQVVRQLIVGGDDEPLSVVVVLRTTRTPKDLHHVQDA